MWQVDGPSLRKSAAWSWQPNSGQAGARLFVASHQEDSHKMMNSHLQHNLLYSSRERTSKGLGRCDCKLCDEVHAHACTSLPNWTTWNTFRMCSLSLTCIPKVWASRIHQWHLRSHLCIMTGNNTDGAHMTSVSYKASVQLIMEIFAWPLVLNEGMPMAQLALYTILHTM